jgi:hypothetical protein
VNNKTVFTRTEREAKPLRGQAAVVLEAVEARTDGGTIEQLAKDVSETLVTRQDPERVVAYYLCIFKKQGIVRVTRPEDVPADETETVSEDELELAE